MKQPAKDIEILGLPTTGGEPLPIPEQRGFLTTVWEAVYQSRLVRTGVAAAAGVAVLTACGQAEGSQTPSGGGNIASATGEQTPGSGSTTTPESSTRPPATSTSPSSTPSASQSAQPSSGNTSGSGNPTSSSPNSSRSTSTGEVLTVGRPVSFPGKIDRLPWETTDRGAALENRLLIKANPKTDTAETVMAQFFERMSAIQNTGTGITLKERSSYNQVQDRIDDLRSVRQSYISAVTADTLSSLPTDTQKWFEAMDNTGEITSNNIAGTALNHAGSIWGEKGQYLVQMEVTARSCEKNGENITCDVEVSRWTEKKLKSMGEDAKDTSMLKVNATETQGSWNFWVYRTQ